MQAVSILFACVNWLGVVKGVHHSSIELLSPLLPDWLKLFVPILARPDSFDSDCSLKITILQVLWNSYGASLFLFFVTQFNKRDFLPPSPPLWLHLKGLGNFGQSVSSRNRTIHERYCASRLEVTRWWVKDISLPFGLILVNCYYSYYL